jgi:hypothetical protein
VSAAFEVGQKVTHNIRGSVEIAYGPYTNTFGSVCYVMRLEGGREVSVQADTLSAIPEPPKFAVGDVVTSDGSLRGKEGVLVAGPFVSPVDADHFWVADVDGQHYTPKEAVLRQVEPAPIKVGDRVRVVKDDPEIRTGEFVGRVGAVVDTGNHLRDDLNFRIKFPSGAYWWCAEVERVEDENTYTHNGVTYDLTARYRDKDGDTLRIKLVDGVARVAWFGEEPYTDSNDLPYAVRNYGPLTRV